MSVFISTSGLRCHNEKQHRDFSPLLSYISLSYVSEPASFKANKEAVGAANALLLTQQPYVMKRPYFSNLHLREPKISYTFPPQKRKVGNTAESDYLDIFIWWNSKAASSDLLNSLLDKSHICADHLPPRSQQMVISKRKVTIPSKKKGIS